MIDWPPLDMRLVYHEGRFYRAVAKDDDTFALIAFGQEDRVITREQALKARHDYFTKTYSWDDPEAAPFRQ